MEHIEHPDIAHIMATGYPCSIKCPNCGTKIDCNNQWYSDWYSCDNCIDDYKEDEEE